MVMCSASGRERLQFLLSLIVFKYADWLGADVVCARAEAYAHLGKAYEPTPNLRAMAASRGKYYS